MSFVRPEARAALWRWREAIAGIAVIGLGASWVAGPGGMLGWIGWALVLGGAVLAFAGLQRARFRAGGGGPGVVQLDEGRVTYFGPLSGGTVDLADLAALDYDPLSYPPVWILCRRGHADIHVPVNADGADTLFDAFATLPGMQIETLIRDRDNARSRARIWHRPFRSARLQNNAGT